MRLCCSIFERNTHHYLLRLLEAEGGEVLLDGQGDQQVVECCRRQPEALFYIVCLGRRTFPSPSEHDHRTNGCYISPNDSVAPAQ